MSKKPGLVSVWTMDYREAGEQQQYSTENIGGGDCNNYERFWRHWGMAKTISGDPSPGTFSGYMATIEVDSKL